MRVWIIINRNGWYWAEDITGAGQWVRNKENASKFQDQGKASELGKSLGCNVITEVI